MLQITGVNRFRYLAYYKGAKIVSGLGVDLRAMHDEGKDFKEIPGIGKAMADKIVEILETSQCAEHQRLLSTFKKGLLELLSIRGLGPKKVKKFYDELGVDDIFKLKAAAESGELAALEGMGEKSQAEILKSIADHEKHRERMLLHQATSIAEMMVAYMKDFEGVDRVDFAGSCRRGRATIGDVDILATGPDHASIIDHFVRHPQVETILAQGETKCSVLIDDAFQVDLRVVAPESFGAALYYFTGSKDHNVHARKLAISKGWKLNEYGLYDGEKRIAGSTETEIFEALGLPFIPPEVRQDYGEFSEGIPPLLELQDIRGDLHVHTRWSDGRAEMEDMVAEAVRLGYEYIALTDHSPSVRVAYGMSNEKLLDYIRAIDALQKKVPHIKILKGSEVDILVDGSLDYPDELLAQLDLVNVSVHHRTNLSAAEQTARVVKALAHPAVTILNHPTGRVVKKRESYAIDLVEVARAAAAHNVALEVNGSKRLDLNGTNIRVVKDHGVKFVVSTDSHDVPSLSNMKFGVKMARRGWLTADDVLNTRGLNDFMAFWGK